MTRLIVITSAKGGVGKTTLASNLAAALTNLGQRVIVMDGNVTTPNLGIHLGMPLAGNSLHDVLRGDKRVSDVIYPHSSGYKVIPASLSVNDLVGADVARLPEVTFSLLGKADFVIIDSAAGIGREAVSALSAANEAIVITNPDLPSVTDALKMVQVAKNTRLKIAGVVINKVMGLGYEMTRDDIEDLLEVPVIAEIPYDVNVPISITTKKPVVEYNLDSPASVEIMRLASNLSGVSYTPRGRPKGIFAKFLDIFRMQ
jgi:septum site-determining protein MinD